MTGRDAAGQPASDGGAVGGRYPRAAGRGPNGAERQAEREGQDAAPGGGRSPLAAGRGPDGAERRDPERQDAAPGGPEATPVPCTGGTRTSAARPDGHGHPDGRPDVPAPERHKHSHSHSHAHAHGSARAGARHKGRLLAALLVLGAVAVVEVVAGLATRSLALLSDAGHMLTDVSGIGMALAAIHLADREATRRHRTFGLYRLEILAALANSVLLFGVAAYVVFEAVGRFGDGPEVLAGPMLAVAIVGLVANVVAFALLRQGSSESLNVEGAYLEVLSDLLGSVGVIVAASVLAVTGWEWVDPVVGVGIGLFILPRAWRLGAQAVRILVQAAPPGTDLDGIEAELLGLEGVVDVHDLHVWTLTSEMEVASAHLMVCAGIDHATLQVEPDTHRGCDEMSW